MELKRDEIVKALEHCFGNKPCNKCEWHEAGNGCMSKLEQSAISLIKELTEEKRMLSESYDHLEKTKDELLAERSRLTEENERLRRTQVVQHIHIDEQFRKECEYEMKQLKADTVRDMQERLKETIDRIAEEVLEGKND